MENSDQVLQRWVIIKSKGLKSNTRKPLKNNHQATVVLLKELKKQYPESIIILAELAYGGDLWVSDIDNVLEEAE